MTNNTIAVIGAGFSGTLTALHLLHLAPAGTRITLIERSGPFGPGLAYSTGNPHHLLNVPAGRMSAFEHRPRDFLDWLERQPAQVLEGVEPTEATFVPRRLFGAYLRHLLNAALLQPSPNTLDMVHDTVVAIEHARHGLVLRLASGQSVIADRAVLASGNQQPGPIQGDESSFCVSPLWHSNALTAGAFADLCPMAPLLLIGTGLTMVDAVISLLNQGHVGPIYALSRRGLLPRPHASAPARGKLRPLAYPADIGKLTRLLRQEAARVVATGHAWQSVIDALRPFTQDLWQTMPPDQRQRFLRHLRPWWDVHRHRMPQQIAERIDAASACGQLRIVAGRIRGYGPTEHMVDVRFQPRGGEQTAVLRVARVLNCTGPAADFTRIEDPLIRSLLSIGSARTDAHRLGLDITTACELRDRTGNVSRRLFAVGPLTRGAFWEITAVPDIRRQCVTLATHISHLMQAQTRKSPRVLRYAA